MGRDDTETIIANGIGFLSQAYEATAGLIGNTLVALAAHPELLERSVNDGSLLRQTILEVIRYDPPVQNTRRFCRAGRHDCRTADESRGRHSGRACRRQSRPTS